MGEYGIVTPPLDMEHPKGPLTPAEEALRQAMEALCADADLCAHYTQKGQERLLAFTPETIWRQWDEVIEKRL